MPDVKKLSHRLLTQVSCAREVTQQSAPVKDDEFVDTNKQSDNGMERVDDTRWRCKLRLRLWSHDNAWRQNVCHRRHLHSIAGGRQWRHLMDSKTRPDA